MKKFINTIRALFAELGKVSWTKPKELLTLLVFIIVICGIISLVMTGLDIFFIRMREILLKL